ncbi:MAG: glutamine-hydrolyzing carbamoyl-phosphate synthase small subunit [Phycisphaerales bacterium]|nr:glutamine-hydrolyzing carbamoyl-phosphate synthase small subunit [Phycisphaerales bacterium]
MNCALALADGTIFRGRAFGAAGTQVGEVVFNTSMTGYQEIFTDPSYCGQIVTMTFPLMGNYGVNREDFESTRAWLSGFVVREVSPRPSNYRATGDLEGLLREQGVIGISDIDTRALTRRIREHGAVNGVISTETSDARELVKAARAAPSMVGANLVERVISHDISEWAQRVSDLERTSDAALPTKHIVALDCGIKQNILRHLATAGCRVTVAPSSLGADAIRALKPDALVVGNGPGDPAAVGAAIETLRELIGSMPMLGVCLGHQLLSLALGAETYKLRFGHHGGNVPVFNRPAGRVEITSQNHGFAVEAASLERAGGEVTHVNLNDDSIEGFVHAKAGLIAVQFHPEAGPGPHDAAYLFRAFAEAVAEGRGVDAGLLAFRN